MVQLNYFVDYSPSTINTILIILTLTWGAEISSIRD